MNQLIKSSFWGNYKSDVPASIVVFLVAVPLCLGIAMASGAPLFSGIISGIVGGIVVTLVSKSPVGVSGPAAGLAVIVLSSIQELDTFETFLLCVVIAGVFQIVLGILKAGVIGYYFPSAVIKGMLAGIGIIIILKQIPHAFGYDKDPEGDFEFFQLDGHTTFSDLIYMLKSVDSSAIIITLISLAILILWEQKFMKGPAIFKIIQGPLVAVMAGIGLNLYFSSTGSPMQPEHLVALPVADSLGGFFTQFTFPDFTQLTNPRVYVIALTIAVVASLETLLCVEATDKLDPYKRVTPTNRELIAQGVGNMAAGLIGGIPVTQVIVRSSANIQSGGKSKASAFLHGVLILAFVMAIPKLLNLVPLASLAAILLVVGYKLAKPALFKEMFKLGKAQFVPFVVTILGIVFMDLLLGIALGMIVAVFHILWQNFKIPYHFNPDAYQPGQPIHIQMAEEVTFLNKASILRTLNKLPDDTHVVLDASSSTYMHPDVVEIIEDFRENAKTRDITVELVGFDQGRVHQSTKIFDQAVVR